MWGNLPTGCCTAEAWLSLWPFSRILEHNLELEFCPWEGKTGPYAPHLFGRQVVYYQETVVSPGPGQSNLFPPLEGIQQIISYCSKIFSPWTVGKPGTWRFVMANLCRHLVITPACSDVQWLVALWFPKKCSRVPRSDWLVHSSPIFLLPSFWRENQHLILVIWFFTDFLGFFRKIQPTVSKFLQDLECNLFGVEHLHTK